MGAVVAAAAALGCAESASADAGVQVGPGDLGARHTMSDAWFGCDERPTSGGVVTQYVVGSSQGARVRSSPTLRTPTVVARLRVGEAVTGRYNSTGYWFQVTRGPHAGRWIAGSMLHTQWRGSAVNGRVSRCALEALPDAVARRGGATGQVRLSRAAADAFGNMNAAFHRRFGHDLGVLEGYRTLATQKEYANRFGSPRAAVPGMSNHGFGNAVDVSEVGRSGASSPFFYGHVYDRWLQHNAWRWGFDRPDDFDAGGSNPEYWHYDFVG